MDASFLISAFRENQYPLPDRPEIAFAGRSNVGKSSLINILANRKGLAKTSSRPGRTQSINFFGVNDLLYLVDLPGYGFARHKGYGTRQHTAALAELGPCPVHRYSFRPIKNAVEAL